MAIKKIGLIVADIDEYRTLEATLKQGKYEDYSFLGRVGHRFWLTTGDSIVEVISILTGVGKVNAAAGAMHLLDIGCDLIVNYGLSGGISNASRGDIVICDRFIEHDFDLTGIGYKLCEKPLQRYIYTVSEKVCGLAQKALPFAKIGTAVSGDCFICDEATREKLKTAFSAMTGDMETAAIAYVCDFGNLPFVCVRRVSDNAGADAVDVYREMNTSDETVLSDMALMLCRYFAENYE